MSFFGYRLLARRLFCLYGAGMVLQPMEGRCGATEGNGACFLSLWELTAVTFTPPHPWQRCPFMALPLASKFGLNPLVAMYRVRLKHCAGWDVHGSWVVSCLTLNWRKNMSCSRCKKGHTVCRW